MNIGIGDLINQAKNMGVKIYTQDNQLKVDMPWPVWNIPEPVRYILGELKKRQSEIQAYLSEDPVQEEYWRNVLTNAYFLYYPKGNGEYEPLRPLHDLLEKLKNWGAKLSRVESRFEQGKIVDLEILPGNIDWADWNYILVKKLLHYREQLDWLLKISAMGVARDYVDLGVDFPPEWISDSLGKHAARIAELRRAVIEEMMEKNQCNGLYFEIEGGRMYCLVPCKTGRQDVTELTPEEVMLVAEAQNTGLLPPGLEGARSALKWIN